MEDFKFAGIWLSDTGPILIERQNTESIHPHNGVVAISGTVPIVLSYDIFNKIKIDPAIASAPFISTSLDIIGQIIYFSITLSIIGIFYS